ncbi:helix-turn-helix domain-containing protein [Sinorhizobium meliloti]|nr:helix-turn-helix domain-containing protein [Sinorhizobium meliloti]MDW9979106.1 helix-turn-helix domain-containing protein [Sinorhizobium meliloti]MDX0295728.1 helix-turn-helix domain-containing protein [Sinorhizobium meliloti]
MDVLLDICRSMQLTGGVFLEAEFTAPWCVTSQIAPEDCGPFMPQPAQLIAYHYVTAGRLILQTDGHSPVPVQAGEIILMPRNDEHVIGSSTNVRPVNAHFLIQPAAAGGLARIAYGGGGERTLILCGYLGTNSTHATICDILPRMLKIGVEEGASGDWIESSFRFAAQQLSAGRIESPAVLAKLAELLFVEAVCRYVRSLPPEASGWLAGLRDRAVGRALALLHSRMTHPWTTEELAQQIGLSRSAFAERFTSIMGEPPMRYLANWRMQIAAQRLRGSHEPIARIAFEIGYESEAAFNRAFRRTFEMPPTAWRKMQSGGS